MIQLLYLATLALHAVFVGYVFAGTGVALALRTTPLAASVRARLPFMLGCGITAGVAPLLFLQLLHQRRFYTANLLLGPRWMALVPALIVGFYALYLAKHSVKWRTLALAAGMACFAFVAWSWSELHELMAADDTWRDFYAAGERQFAGAGVAARFVVFGGAMLTLFATVQSWPVADKRLAILALAGRVVSAAGAGWLVARGFDTAGPWPKLLVAAVVFESVGWLFVLRDPDGFGLSLATAGGTAALAAAVVVREAPRLALVEPEHALSAGAGGGIVFAIAAVIGVVAIAWVVRTVRSAAPEDPHD